MPNSWLTKRETLIALLIVCALGAGGAFLKLQYLGTTPSGDYNNYVATAQLISGESVPADQVQSIPSRILKPLNPLLVAGLHLVMPYWQAFILQALFFYFALAVVMFALCYEFLQDRLLASLGALLVILSYPMLRYGVDILTETGAIFFYTLSLWLTLSFLKFPQMRVFFSNIIALIVGFLWKEYSAVSAVIFGLALVFHPSLESRSKVRAVVVYALLFLAVNIPFQLYVFLTYHYTYISWWTQGGAPISTACGFNAHDIIKSTAALLGLAWLAVPFGVWKFRSLPAQLKTFLLISLPVPFMAFIWGCVSSRLLYVIAPPFILLALWGMKDWKRGTQIAFVAVTIAANITWLFLSYSIKV